MIRLLNDIRRWWLLSLAILLLGMGWAWASRVSPSVADVGQIPSPREGFPAPDFTLATLDGAPVSLAAQRGKVVIVNLWASWCIPCRTEAGQLAALKARGIPVVGVAIRDRGEDVADFLGQYGDPFERIGSDPTSQVQFQLGSSGVPETYVVDGKGVIRHQHIGAIMDQDMATIIAAYEAAK